MHVLSVADIQLIVDLYDTQDVVRDPAGRERQLDSLIRMGYLRPMRGIFTLTELGEKTARSLQARRFVPSRAEDAPPAPAAPAAPAALANAETTAEQTSETPAERPADQPSDEAAAETEAA